MTRPASRRFAAARVALLATVCVILVGLVSPASAHPGAIHVRSGQSIQAVIDQAGCGDQILVEEGTYAEQLTIEKDGIALIGLGAILTPPPAPTPNICSGLAGSDTQAGICVMGSGVVLADFVSEHRKVLSVGQRVKDVSVVGFEVRGFSGENIAVVGAKDARVTGNNLVDGQQYGCLTVGSKNTRITGNAVVSSAMLRFIGICMDDVAGVQVSNNRISGYITGLCVQTPGADVRQNDVSDACFGAFVDPAVDGAKVCYNNIGATDPGCPEKSADGILVDGAVNTEVRHNFIEGQRDAGIAVVDDPTTNPVAVASGNVVAQNTLSTNGVDLFVSTNGTDNVIVHNECSTSQPPGLCA